jgi:hypothetical protein
LNISPFDSNPEDLLFHALVHFVLSISYIDPEDFLYPALIWNPEDSP